MLIFESTCDFEVQTEYYVNIIVTIFKSQGFLLYAILYAKNAIHGLINIPYTSKLLRWCGSD